MCVSRAYWWSCISIRWEAIQVHLGRLHVEVRPLRRVDAALPETHGRQTLQVRGLRPKLLALGPSGPAPPQTHAGLIWVSSTIHTYLHTHKESWVSPNSVQLGWTPQTRPSLPNRSVMELNTVHSGGEEAHLQAACHLEIWSLGCPCHVCLKEFFTCTNGLLSGLSFWIILVFFFEEIYNVKKYRTDWMYVCERRPGSHRANGKSTVNSIVAQFLHLSQTTRISEGGCDDGWPVIQKQVNTPANDTTYRRFDFCSLYLRPLKMKALIHFPLNLSIMLTELILVNPGDEGLLTRVCSDR